jgi:ATP-dependent DNA helicase RecQ
VGFPEHGDSPGALALLAAWRDEAGDSEAPATRIRELCYETLAEQRRERSVGVGVLMATLHAAKGLEFPHVLIPDGGWRSDSHTEEERRLLYVGMTRARETLTLGALATSPNPHLPLLQGDAILRTPVHITPPPPEVTARRYSLLTPADLDLGYPGRRPPRDPIHRRLQALQTGDELRARAEGERVILYDGQGRPIARLSARASSQWLSRLTAIEHIHIVALLQRRRQDGDPAYRESYRSEVWEVPLVEVAWRGQ